MTDLSFEIRFIDSGLPGGEINASDLARVCASLQELAGRVGRWVFDSAQLGRLPKAPEEVTRVRVTGLAKGSTRLQVSTSPAQGAFHDTFPLADQTNRLFWEIVRGSGVGALPKDAPSPVRRTAHGLMVALGGSAPKIEVRATSADFDGTPVTYAPKDAVNDPWFDVETDPVPVSHATASGTLEMVNLHTRHFRIRDAVGNTFDLVKVPEALHAAQLVGQLVVAAGEAVPGKPRAIAEPTLESVDLPAWEDDSAERQRRFQSSLGSAHPFNAEQGPAFELSDSEWDAFWAAVHGQ
jgi:hypothetical protein